MALLNELVGQAARFNEYLTRKFSIIGGAPSPQLTPEITPVDVIGADFADRALLREVPFFWQQQVTAGGAGKYGWVQLRNPAGSGILVVIEQLLISHGAAAAVMFGSTTGVTTTDLTNVVSNGPNLRDTRFRTAAAIVRASAVFSYKNDAALPTLGGVRAFCLPGTPYILPIAQVLGPGGNAVLTTFTENTEVSLGWVWRERPAGKNEELLL